MNMLQGHYARDCHSGSGVKRNGDCYFCAMPGHHQWECASLKEAQVKTRR